ncbi:hypothetical protein SLS54_001655 [Diplodia seriata]
MPALLDLPTELLQKVVSTLPRSQDVAAVAATCRKLNRVASGELYENIRLKLPEPVDLKDLGVIVNLASSLFLGDPVLRHSTKSISITLPDMSTRFLPRLVPRRLRATADIAGLEQWGITTLDQSVNLADGQVWAYMTLLLHACRNIHTLHLDGNFFKMLDFWKTDLQAFGKLQTVELITSGAASVPRPPPSVAILAGLSHIPNLRTLRLTISGNWVRGLDPVRPIFRSEFPPFAHITTLALWKCELRMLVIRTLLGHMPHLVSLEIDLLFVIDLREQDNTLKWCLIDLGRLRKAILGTGLGGALGKYRKEGQHCSNTLEHLKISVDFSCKRFTKSSSNMDLDYQVLPEQEEASWGWDDSDSDESSEEDDDDDDELENHDEEDDSEDDSEEEREEEVEVKMYGAVYSMEPGNPPYPQRRGTQWEINELGSLKGLKKLKTLEIEPMFLSGNHRPIPTQGDDDVEPGPRPRWTPLDVLLPDSLEEFRIANGPVGWVLLSGDTDFLRTQGAGADLSSLSDMFVAYKEGGGHLPNLRKVVHTVRASPCPWDDPSWDEQQMELKGMLKDLAVDYEWPC